MMRYVGLLQNYAPIDANAAGNNCANYSMTTSYYMTITTAGHQCCAELLSL